jgi:hypothetical protein
LKRMNNSREFLYHMLREIHEQPRAVRDTLAGRLAAIDFVLGALW